MIEKVIPLLRNIKTKEPSVTLAALAVYEEMGKGLGHDVVASEILPALWPMTVGVLLNTEQVRVLSPGLLRSVQPFIERYSRAREQGCSTASAKTSGTQHSLWRNTNDHLAHARKPYGWFTGRGYIGF